MDECLVAKNAQDLFAYTPLLCMYEIFIDTQLYGCRFYSDLPTARFAQLWRWHPLLKLNVKRSDIKIQRL